MCEVNLVAGLKTSSSENIFGCYKKINLINYADLKGLLNPRKKTEILKGRFELLKNVL